jgi:hypothetical protein
MDDERVLSLMDRMRRSSVGGSLRNAAHRVRAASKDLLWSLCPAVYLSRWLDYRLKLDGSFWLFILGVNNSGTTVLAKILESHPAVRSLPGEGHFLTKALPMANRYGVARLFSSRPDVFRWTEESPADPALRARYDWSWYYPRRTGILLEKSPPNTLRARWLQTNFHPSRFISIFRHPYGVCEGIRRRIGRTIAEAAEHWHRANEYLLEDIPYLHRCLSIRYEGLCASPGEHLLKLAAFLDLEQAFDARALLSLDSPNIDNTQSALRNFNARSISRLSAQDISTINTIAGSLMEQLGYEQL